VLPTLYNLVEGAKERRAAKRAGGSDAAASVDPEPTGDAPAGAGLAGAATTGGLPPMPPVHQTRRSRRGPGADA
jgi:hypothetical protein